MVIMQNTIDLQQDATQEQAKTFVDALKNKYVEQEEFGDRLTLPKNRKINTEITFVGFGKVSSIQKQLRGLTLLDLSSMNINSVGQLDELKNCLVRVRMLNLANNRLDWNDIVSIISLFPNLKELILTGNILASNYDASKTTYCAQRGIVSLTLGRVYLDWTLLIQLLSHMWTQVEEIDLWDNRLTNKDMKLICLTGFELFLTKISVLKLSHNLFTDIQWLNHSGRLDNLRELDLSNCKLQTILIDSDLARKLCHLTILNVSYNYLDDWTSIASLYALKNLKSLLCVDNPLFLKEQFAKSLTIGRLKTLESLNREEITPGQRRDAEIFYFRKTFPEYEQYKSGSNKYFKLSHPRYEELIDLYGLPEDLIKKQVVEKYINVELIYDSKKITKKLPCDMRVANVKMLCKKLFRLNLSSSIEITCCDPSFTNNSIRYTLDQDGQTLHFFSVKSGHTLLIEEKDH